MSVQQTGQTGPDGQPTLVKAYRIDNGDSSDYDVTVYRPRQFAAGLDIDAATDRAALVNEPGEYAGWDALLTPNENRNNVSTSRNWLTVTLNRPATIAVGWRALGTPPPGWLAGWERGPTVVVDGLTLPTFRRAFPAGDVALGGVYDPPETQARVGLQTPLVLLAEADGRPSPVPSFSAGREVPRSNETCPDWVHESYVTSGPDGRTYPTWHPQIDPVYWCYFRHEHGSDPSAFDSRYRPPYGYTASRAGLNEPHPGFKTYVLEDAGFNGYRWMVTHHFGTGSIDRACVRYHEASVAVKDVAANELVADLHFMADFGKSVSNATGQPLAPARCPSQAADAGGSYGARELPIGTQGPVFYEPWQMDTRGLVLGLSAAFGFNTPGVVVYCNTPRCDAPVINPAGDGSFRFLSYVGFGLTAGASAGTFHTDPTGRTVVGAGAPGAVRQYVKPGLRVPIKQRPDNEECYDTQAWGHVYQCRPDPLTGTTTNRENSLRVPN